MGPRDEAGIEHGHEERSLVKAPAPRGRNTPGHNRIGTRTAAVRIAGFSEDTIVAAQAYCVKCKTKREMKDATQITMKNGRPATEGKCPECGTKMFKIGAAS